MNPLRRRLFNRPQPWRRGLVGYWPLEAPSGTALDRVGPHHLTATNNPLRATGKVGYGRGFVAASSQQMSVSSIGDLLKGADVHLMIQVWAFPTDLTANRTFVARYEGAGNREWMLRGLSTGNASFLVSSDGTNTAGTASAAITANQWNHILAWHDPDGNTINLQVNNGAVASAAVTTGIFSGTPLMRIAGRSGEYMQGTLDEVAIWKGRKFTAEERARLYNNGFGVKLI